MLLWWPPIWDGISNAVFDAYREKRRQTLALAAIARMLAMANKVPTDLSASLAELAADPPDDCDNPETPCDNG